MRIFLHVYDRGMMHELMTKAMVDMANEANWDAGEKKKE